MTTLQRAERTSSAIADRIAALDWTRIGEALDTYGCATIENLLTRQECAALTRMYADDDRFRSRVVMARHGFGRGEYKYFTYPLPTLVDTLRWALSPPLAGVANRWNEHLEVDVRYPADH